MKTKIITPAGCMYSYKDKISEKMLLSFRHLSMKREIDIKTVMPAKNKDCYKVKTPFGYAYIKNSESINNVIKYSEYKHSAKNIVVKTVY